MPWGEMRSLAAHVRPGSRYSEVRQIAAPPGRESLERLVISSAKSQVLRENAQVSGGDQLITSTAILSIYKYLAGDRVGTRSSEESASELL